MKQLRNTLPPKGALLLALLCFTWGANMTAIKFGNEGVSPVCACLIRSCAASFCLYLYARVLGIPVFLSRENARHGFVVGAMFGLEFLLLYWGTAYTSVSRAVIFLYTQPLWTALGAFLVLGSRLTTVQIIGSGLCFAGLVAVFGGKAAAVSELHWIGDVMETMAGFLWAATTIYIKKRLSGTDVSHHQMLFAQLFYSIPVLLIGVVFLEGIRPVVLTPAVVLSLVYQSVIVAFVSYLAWFWMITRYNVGVLAAFTFLTPIFGVLISNVVLSEPLTAPLAVGLFCAAIGIYLVNRPQAA